MISQHELDLLTYRRDNPITHFEKGLITTHKPQLEQAEVQNYNRVPLDQNLIGV
uniref:Uncharacterized protein n=1 Tax=Arundo donax TaxID=35708 RepID=A0A0A9E6A7_ARUDO